MGFITYTRIIYATFAKIQNNGSLVWEIAPLL